MLPVQHRQPCRSRARAEPHLRPRRASMDSSSLSGLAYFLLFIVGAQFLGFLASCALQTEKFFDFWGSITFLLVAILSLAAGGYLLERQVLVTSLVGLWAIRLGSFLLLRVLKDGKDVRFDGVRDKPLWLFVFWAIQALWIALTSLPVILLNFSAEDPLWPQFNDFLGVSLWVIGFLIETVSDFQKFEFRQIKENKHRWIDVGLWRYSRHPNYFGEILLWWGIFAASSPALDRWKLLLGVLSPLYATLQLVLLSGIPILEKSADDKWGNQEEYVQFKEKTPVLVPWINFPKYSRRKKLD